MNLSTLFSTGLLATLLAAAAPAQADPVFGRNLIVNGDAEADPGAADAGSWGPVTGFTTTVGHFTAVNYGASGGFPFPSDPGPVSRGRNFFAGGPDIGRSVATQLMDFSAVAGAVDAGVVSFDLSAYLGGWSSQPDYAVLTLAFLDTSSAVIGSATLGPVTNKDRGSLTGLLLRDTGGAVPVGARSARLTVELTRFEGSYDDGYADNLSLVLSGPTGPVGSLPEPASAGLAALALLGLAGVRRRSRG